MRASKRRSAREGGDDIILGGFIADFVCFDARLIVEVDGATHSTNEEIARDAARSAALVVQGFAVLRFTNDDVFRNLEGVLETISRNADGIEAAHR